MGIEFAKISPNKKFSAETNGALVNVVSRKDRFERYSIALNNYDLIKPDIFRWSADSEALGMLITRSIPYDAGGWMGAKKNYWVGIWYPFQAEFYAVHFPEHSQLEINYQPIDSIEVLATERIVICSINGKVFKQVQMPEEPMPSKWEKEKQSLKDIRITPAKPGKKEWTWNHNSDGYEGVSIYGEEVLWFSHAHNPHASGGAQTQSFENFLEKGPACSTPSEYFPELFEAVR